MVRTSSDGERGLSLLGAILALLIIAVILWLIAQRFQARLGEEGADEGPRLSPAATLDHTRQRQTLADMKLIATLNDLRYAESGRFAERLADLQASGRSLEADGWGNRYVYSSGGGSYTLTSLGSDGAPGPAPPEPWPGSPYEPDLVMSAGRFTQAPSGR